MNWQDRCNPQAGGAETHLHEIFGRLASRGHDLTVLVSGWPGAAPRVTLDGMSIHRTGGRYTYSLAAPRYFRRHLRREAFDVIIEDLNKVPLFTPLWVRRPLVLLVHHLFGTTAFQEASLPIATTTWLLEKPAPRVYRRVPVQAVSQSTADDLVHRGFGASAIRVIPNGIDLDFFTPDPAVPEFPEPTLLYLGRVKKYKRIDLIVRAVARLRDQGLSVRLIIAGSGDALADLRRLRAQLDLETCVDLPGFVDEQEKRRLFRQAWIHILTSPKEGWGISNIEAAACATPTIASDSPGLRDSVRDGVTGFLVPHGDVEVLAERIRALVLDTDLRARLGAEARRFAERFTWERAARETEDHLLEVTQSSRPARAPRRVIAL